MERKRNTLMEPALVSMLSMPNIPSIISFDCHYSKVSILLALNGISVIGSCIVVLMTTRLHRYPFIRNPFEYVTNFDILLVLQYFIGSSSDCQLFVDDKSVSPIHCIVKRKLGNKWTVRAHVSFPFHGHIINLDFFFVN